MAKRGDGRTWTAVRGRRRTRATRMTREREAKSPGNWKNNTSYTAAAAINNGMFIIAALETIKNVKLYT